MFAGMQAKLSTLDAGEPDLLPSIPVLPPISIAIYRTTHCMLVHQSHERAKEISLVDEMDHH